MAQRVRPGLMAEQKREMWSRWKAGQSLSEIGRALGRERSSIHRMVASTGGYMPTPRRRSPRVLSSAEREEMSMTKTSTPRGSEKRNAIGLCGLGRVARSIRRPGRPRSLIIARVLH